VSIPLSSKGPAVEALDDEQLSFRSKLTYGLGDVAHSVGPGTIIPPDATMRQIMEEEGLAGLIVIDEDWYLDTENFKTIACGVEITLLDEAGNVIYNSDPGLQTDGEEKFTNLLQDFVQEMSFSLFGDPNIEAIEDSLEKVNAEMAESIVNRLETFTSGE